MKGTVFKYEAFTTQSLMNLKSQAVYFGSPRNFNDPYDCAIAVSVADPSAQEIEHARVRYGNDPTTPEELRQRFATIPADALGVQLQQSANQALNLARSNFLNTRGVTCFSETNDDLLMWSQYGGRYKGFCLEFRTECEPFSRLRQVKYVKEMPKVSLEMFFDNKFSDQLMESLYCTKSPVWSHEKEWRGIHVKAGTLFVYPPQTLKAIYFGPEIDNCALEIICLIIAGQNPGVELWQGHRSPVEFKVEFERFEYTSHVDAKTQGRV